MFMVLVLSSFKLLATDYYVSTSGNDNNNGSLSSPWRTVLKACTSVPANAGHKINVGAGLFTETNYLIVPAGVSIVGAGSGATTINVNKYYDVAQNLNSCVANGSTYVAWAPAIDKFCMQIPNGSNQVIKGFKMDGQSRTCHGAIYMESGSNVIFDDLNIQRFKFTGLWIYTSTNSEIKNSYFQDNCFGTANQDAGNIMFHANTNLLIHDNTILETGVMSGKGGYGIKTYSKLFVNACFWTTWDANWNAVAEGTKIYNNTITVPPLGTWKAGNNDVPCITIEFNGLTGKNCKIYNNTLNNHISLIGVRGTGYDFQSFDVYNNYFNLGNEYRYACEADAQGMEFRYNYVFGGFYPLAIWGNNAKVTNLKIHHNVFDSQLSNQAIVRAEDGKIFKDLKFYNNTVIDVNGVSSIFRSGIKEATTDSPRIVGSFTDADIRNNIFMSTSPRSDYFSSGILNGTIAHNGFQNIPAKGTNAISGDMKLTLTGNKPAPYATLQSSSPAINNGVIISGITDGYISIPERGAFEFGATPWTAGANAVPNPNPNPNPTAVTIPARIQAENFSAMNGVVIEPTTDTGGGSNIGYVDNNDWVDYLINAPTAGTYTVDLRIASQVANSQLQIRSGSTVLASVNVPNTGGWQTYQTVSRSINLSAGVQTIRLFCSVQNWNLNWVEFKSQTSSNTSLNIGQTAIMSGQDSGSAAYLNAQTSSLSQTATIQSMSINIKAAAGQMYMGVYSNVNGKPGTLLASTPQFTPVVGWNTINVSTPVSMTAGTYWLAYQPNDNALGQAFSTTSGTTYFVQPRNYGVLPSTYPPSTLAANVESSVYATFTVGNTSSKIESSELLKVNDESSEVSLNVYPIPTDGDFTVAFKGFSNPTVSIIDISGRTVYSQKVATGSSLQISNNFKKGMYYVYVTDGVKKEGKKILLN